MVRKCYHFQTKAAYHAKLNQVQALQDDSVLKVGNDSISTYHLANTEMCHLNSAFIQEEKIVSLQIFIFGIMISFIVGLI
jgi:molybdate-binding protein